MDVNQLTRSTRFVKFLREAVAIKTKPVLEVQKYPFVIWFSDLPPNTQELRSPLITANWPEADQSWLKVARVSEPSRPPVPESCALWLEGVDLDSPGTPPTLNAECIQKNEIGEFVPVVVTLEAQLEWEQYLESKWRSWAEKATIIRSVRPVYQKLFAMYQQMQSAADTFDLFVGVGLFSSRTAPEQPFRRHLLAFPAEISLDDRTGTLRLGPAADFISARVETDFLPVADRARLQPQLDILSDDVMNLGAGVADQTAVGSVVTRLVTPINAVTRYVPELKPADASPNAAVVSFGAAIVLRPRSTRSLDALLAKIEKDTANEVSDGALEKLPVPWRKMMEDDRVWNGDAGADAHHTELVEPVRTFFPLPSNEEQSRIVARAEGSPGVVVQGPPGTGKSHTIANLISHYLALGRRVLVTAQSAQALEVLRDKLPADLQQLCVTLLGDSRASDRDLRRSVDGILNRQQDFRPRDCNTRIENFEQQLKASEQRINDLERMLHHARAAETQVLEPLQGYKGTRAQIARTLRDERHRFAWLSDPITYGTVCPTYREAWEALATYHASLDSGTRAHLAYELIDLPFEGADASAAVQAVVNAKASFPPNAPDPSAQQPPSLIEQSDLRSAGEWLRTLAHAESMANPDDSSWMSEIRGLLLRSTLVWRTRHEECAATLAPLTDAVVAATFEVGVSERTHVEARRDLMRLEEHYARGGGRRRLGVFKPGVVKETDWVESAVTVQGLPVKQPEEVSRARQALDGWTLLEGACKPWATWPISKGLSPKTQVALLTHRRLLLQQLLTVASNSSVLESDVRQWLAENLDTGVPTTTLLAALQWRLADLALAKARAHRDALVSSLRHAIGNREVVPCLHRLIKALLDESQAGVLAALAELQDEHARRETHNRYIDFVAAVRRTAPTLAKAITAAEGTTALQSAFLDFESAWAHRCVQNWLDTMLSEERIEAAHRAARDERQRQQETLAELTSARAWTAALQRINDRRRATLTAWAQAVSKIPATGKNVFARRAQAQRLLGGCLETIPAWVVSLGRLYETIEPVPGLFDVAIVDEASQCWLDSLVLFYLAKQVIIVGDDKQISPTVVGVAESEIDKLAETFLPDFEYRSSFSLGSSLFDHGRRYLSDGVPLREHFRCVPEIISFSNLLCYQGNPLIPLRQVGKGRLEPLKRTYLPNGIRTHDVNDVEAQAIVDAIEKCHNDSAYEEYDFGVICLQGDMQGERIEQLLLERLGPDVFTKRRLRCGNPYAFQGDERDVMFLSMVAAPNARQQSLTAPMFEQRFNVAMSRARDQAWLFHSIQEDELGVNCLRRRVLDFFKSPPDQQINGSSLDIPHLRLAAERAHRGAEKAPPPFDSWFEVDVALALAARGYTLSAQVEVARKRIDLVVEGDDGVRLAVECDGEAWHGADQYAADLSRQRQLERANWRFVRVRESLFYSDEERAIREVIDMCEELDIAAGGGRMLATTADVAEGWRSTAHESEVDTNAAAGVSEFESIEDDRIEDTVDADTPDDNGFELKPTRIRRTTSSNLSLPLPLSSQRDYPDPRSAPIANVRDAVVDVIKNHGPVTKGAIYGHYRDGCAKLERAGKNLRHAVNSALSSLERTGRVESRDEGRRRLVTDVVYRLPDQPWILARPSIGRDLDDVPLSELANQIVTDRGREVQDDEAALEEVLKEVARRYGMRRFRDQARARLSAATALAFDSERCRVLGLP